jgi:hypothetical protein
MKLDFNILWVEDQPKNVQSQRDAIDKRIRREGFRLQAEFAASVEQAMQYLSDDLYGDHVDLVLMDYDLGAGSKGDKGLLEVRKAFPYKDLVFYSAKGDGLADLVAKTGVQGVFFSARDELPDEVVGVFGTLVKKVLDIDHARGIVVGTSSDIDGLIYDCLGAHFAKSSDALSENAKQIIKKKVKERKADLDKAFKSLVAAVTVSDLDSLHAVYTSMDRLVLLRKLLGPLEPFKEPCAGLESYEQETVPKRNILAHVRVSKKGFSRKLYDRKKGTEITRDYVRNLRLELLKHQETLEALLDQLQKA